MARSGHETSARPYRHGDPGPRRHRRVVWCWDGDPVRELLDGTAVDEYAPGGDQRLLTADLWGDGREEAVWRTTDSRALRICTSAAPTDVRLPTLMHDPQYRVAVARRNVATTSRATPSFYLGDGMNPPPWPEIRVR